MGTHRSTHAAVGIALTAVTALPGGCASNGTPARELPNCNPPQSLVCYGKKATRLERGDRLEDVEFCHCEQLVY